MIEILNRYTRAVMYSHEGPTLKKAVAAAVKSRADLTDADLRGADLTDAVLTDAFLRGADLRGADLTDADLRGADLRDAVLTGADLTDAVLRGIPKIENLDTQILAAIESGGHLEMGSWHTCETTHCRAGWAITIAGTAGKKLESKFGSAAAGALIYWKSTGIIPNFYASNSAAMEDIRDCAAKEAK